VLEAKTIQKEPHAHAAETARPAAFYHDLLQQVQSVRQPLAWLVGWLVFEEPKTFPKIQKSKGSWLTNRLFWRCF